MLRDSPWRPVRLLAAFAACAALSGCYYMQLAAGQMEMNRRRVPIEDLLARPDTGDVLRLRLELATRARDFALSDLALPDNGSYRTYADLGRPYVTWNLFAAPELSVMPKRWCFPVAGCVSYRGYFRESRAEKAAGRLRGKGFDVYVGPSIAYSTLGHLRDPVLNTMFGYGDSELAAFIFHELAHQAVYAQDDSDFNEAFATVVETEGLRRYLAHENRPADLGKFLAARQRQRDAAELLVETRRRLAALYDGALDTAAKREQKAAEFTLLRGALAAGGHPAAGDFNNARLVAVATYERCVPMIRAELDRVGDDLPAFYAAMKLLIKDTAARASVCPP
jgi:predicted aminopeptidase